MLHWIANLPPMMTVTLMGLLGVCVGTFVNLWGIILVSEGVEEDDDPESGAPSFPSYQRFRDVNAVPSPWWHFLPIAGNWLAKGRGAFRGFPLGRSGLVAEVGTGFLFATFAYCYLVMDCQQVAEVRPDDFWKLARLFYHLVLIGLLVAATATDLRDYVIPDRITLPGTIIGLLIAGLSGQLQMIHIWVDWNQEIAGIQGPYLPGWLDVHRHLHGLAWSAAGAAMGAGITWIARALSRVILRREAMGLGDVTLMAMIGSYLGWQPMVFVFFLAPLCALAVAPVSYALSGRTFLAYGPYLSAAAFGVMCSWRWLWLPTRLYFGDATLLMILAAIGLALFAMLLGVLRFFQSEPHERGAGG